MCVCVYIGLTRPLTRGRAPRVNPVAAPLECVSTYSTRISRTHAAETATHCPGSAAAPSTPSFASDSYRKGDGK